MAIEIPTISEIQSRISNDLILSINTGQLDTDKHVDPTIRNSFIKGLVDATAAGFDENNDVLEQLLVQLFPWSATGEFLERWAAYYGINRNAAAKAGGTVVFQGTNGTLVPSATLVQRANGLQYSTLANITISTSTINVSSITRLGSIATVTTTSNHNYATGMTIDSITGADQTEYNVTNTVITVVDATSFTFEVSGTPATPATGTIQVTATSGFGNIEASEFGDDGNAAAGAQLTLVSPIVNVNDTLYVNQDGLVGGLDIEDDESLRERLQERTSNFSAPFTQAGLPVFIKEEVDGVTRVWVQDATPSAGYVTIYFTRDNDTNIIPTASQVTDVKNAIIDPDTGIKPANTPDSYVIVSGLRERLQERTSNFSAPFTQAGLPVFIKEEVDGVTRVWVQDATPSAGYVTIYFTRDNDTNIIPTASQVTDVKNAIIDPDTGIKPANTPDSYVIVSAPTAVNVNFTFSTLSPNTTDMQNSITDALTDYFKNNTNIATDVTEEEYNNIIFSVIDSDGNTPTFTLSAPVGDVTVTTGELAILGTITYP